MWISQGRAAVLGCVLTAVLAGTGSVASGGFPAGIVSTAHADVPAGFYSAAHAGEVQTIGNNGLVNGIYPCIQADYHRPAIPIVKIINDCPATVELSGYRIGHAVLLTQYCVYPGKKDIPPALQDPAVLQIVPGTDHVCYG
jgi:hypothetical protein